MSEKREQAHRVHKVVISGTVEGYDVAPLEELKEAMYQIENLKGEIAALKGLLGDLQRALNTASMRLERLENFLKSFKY